MEGRAVGLFGKLPAKRDFVSRGLGRDFLGPFEPWLQGAVADSRDAFGTAWRAYFLEAPIWRFGIGSGVFGCAAIGAIMPSVDGVGRFFPLVVAATVADGGAFAAPDDADCERWFARVEALMLEALDAVPFERTAGAVAALEVPAVVPGGPAGRTVWCTAGGRDFPPASATFGGLPPVSFMRSMIRPAPQVAEEGHPA